MTRDPLWRVGAAVGVSPPPGVRSLSLPTFSGADDGIRTRDPHLGKVIERELPTCIFTNSRSMIGVFG